MKAVVTQPRLQSLTGRNVEGQEMAGHGPQREGDSERASAGCPPGPHDSLLSSCLQESGEKLHSAREAETNSRGVADEQVLELAQGEVVGMGSSPRVQTWWNCVDNRRIGVSLSQLPNEYCRRGCGRGRKAHRGSRKLLPAVLWKAPAAGLLMRTL